MPFDFKKEYKEFYMPKNKPQIVTIPKMNYIAVRGKGNPNKESGAYAGGFLCVGRSLFAISECNLCTLNGFDMQITIFQFTVILKLPKIQWLQIRSRMSCCSYIAIYPFLPFLLIPAILLVKVLSTPLLHSLPHQGIVLQFER